jgi:hypothetical protein
MFHPLLSMDTALSDIATRKRYNNKNNILAGVWECGSWKFSNPIKKNNW